MFILALPTEASIFSFFEKLNKVFNYNDSIDENDSYGRSERNLQNLALLSAPLNLGINTAQGGGDIEVVGNSALYSVTGPLGSIADVKDITPAADQISIYVVRKGDTLLGIAKMFGVSVNTIRWANNIKSSTIRIGQTLLILPISGVKYEVKKGDTLRSIAKKFKGDVEEIVQFNNVSLEDPLVVGQSIIIPNGEYSNWPSLSASSGSGRVVRGATGPDYWGYYIRPIDNGRITQCLHGYNAIDMASYCGAPVYAAASGDVIIARPYGWNGGYGQFVVISHPNGTQTLYAHLSKIIVGMGWHVVQGQVIGYEGATGRSTGCHVHFEVRGAQNPFRCR